MRVSPDGILSIAPGDVTPEEVKHANKILKILPACVHVAEAQLREYAGSYMVSSGDDIQNPHVWLNPERKHPDDWTLVVEMKDNDGYGWHIEFSADRFKEIWSGS